MNPQPSTLNKPPLGQGIDWSHPLARGLGALWLLNEGAGTLANDLVGRVPAAPTDDRMWLGGSGLRCSGSNYASFPPDPRVFFGDEVTVFASIIPSAFGGVHDDSAVITKGENPWSFYFTVGAGRVNVFTMGDTTWLDGSAAVPLNVRSVVGFTKGADGRKTWLNGSVDTSDSVSSALNWSAVGGRIGHRQDNFDPNNQFTGVIEWVALWNRALAQAEAGLVSREFYSLFHTPRLGGSLALPPAAAVLFRRTEFERAASRGMGPG